MSTRALRPTSRPSANPPGELRRDALNVFVLATEIDLRIGHSQSLKDKRQVVRSVLDIARSRYGLSVAEVSHQDHHQLAGLGFAAVAASARHAEDLIASAEDLVWSRPEIEVLSTTRTWLEP